jgi:hypothetical protein
VVRPFFACWEEVAKGAEGDVDALEVDVDALVEF